MPAAHSTRHTPRPPVHLPRQSTTRVRSIALPAQPPVRHPRNALFPAASSVAMRPGWALPAHQSAKTGAPRAPVARLSVAARIARRPRHLASRQRTMRRSHQTTAIASSTAATPTATCPATRQRGSNTVSVLPAIEASHLAAPRVVPRQAQCRNGDATGGVRLQIERHPITRQRRFDRSIASVSISGGYGPAQARHATACRAVLSDHPLL